MTLLDWTETTEGSAWLRLEAGIQEAHAWLELKGLKKHRTVHTVPQLTPWCHGHDAAMQALTSWPPHRPPRNGASLHQHRTIRNPHLPSDMTALSLRLSQTLTLHLLFFLICCRITLSLFALKSYLLTTAHLFILLTYLVFGIPTLKSIILLSSHYQSVTISFFFVSLESLSHISIFSHLNAFFCFFAECCVWSWFVWLLIIDLNQLFVNVWLLISDLLCCGL